MDNAPSEHDAVRRLAFPLPGFMNVPGYLAAIQGTTSEEAYARLGEPMGVFDGNGLGPMEGWAFEYPCGLQLAYFFYHETGQLVVNADSPELQHAIRHIPYPRNRIDTIPPEGLASELETLTKYCPERAAEVAGLTAFQVLRMDDNGNVFRVGEPTSERDARCHVAQLESLGHKQMYWYERRAG